MTIQISEFAPERHLTDLAELLNNEYRGSFEFIPFDGERIKYQIRRRNMSVLVAEENGYAGGIIGTHLEERGEVDISWLAAREGPDRKRIENLLVDAVERKAKGDSVSAGVDEGSPRIKDWIERGYSLNPGWLRMSAKLDHLKEIVKVAVDTKLRSLRLSEEEKLVEVMNTGFGWRRLELGALENWRVEDPPFTEDWVQVAEIDGRIVSAVVARPDTEPNKYLHLRRGALGPAATLPEFRGRHLASALTARAMNLLFEKGMESVRLGTSELNIPSQTLLRSLGFRVDNVRKILRKKLKNA
ncbi:MAG TPA: GNAT family N-acetyltransferase [Candidatus Bathyarchaeia archaeon]|nr:GNAT family N-acetyltransferase [Candidatus Bathyarchaeia archaeon]